MAFNKKSRITSKKTDITQWYTDIITNSDLFEYGPVKGTMVLEPDGLALWENIKKILNKEFKKIKIDNVSFPLLIPESMLNKEKEHVEGFSPEVLKVTQVGNKKIKDALIIRPTSETLFCDYFSKKINSKTQLPMKYNQWANVMRWENNTRPFLRNSEFFWQEGHTCHATKTEAKETVWQVIDIYKDLIENHLGMAFSLFSIRSGKETLSILIFLNSLFNIFFIFSHNAKPSGSKTMVPLTGPYSNKSELVMMSVYHWVISVFLLVILLFLLNAMNELRF